MCNREPSGKTTSLGVLYIVSTPIGNLEDISLRAISLLEKVSLVAAEDTRRTRKLLSHLGIHTPMTSYFEHNKITKLDAIMAALELGDVALVSDGGTPSISDPGYRLVRAAVDRGHRVIAVPGSSALLAGLVVSGLATDAFVFLGFLPRKSASRRRLLSENATDHRTLVAFETPHRLISALVDIEAEMGDRFLSVARELTKVHEEIFRGTACAAREHFSLRPVRGEITLVIGGAPKHFEKHWSDSEVRDALRDELKSGAKTSRAASTVAARSGWSRREVYRIALENDI